MRKLLLLLMVLPFLFFTEGVMAQGTVTIGSGTATNTTIGSPTPYGTYYENHRQQYLYLASELSAAGLASGNITAIAFDVDNLNTCMAMPSFSIKVKQTTATVLTTTFDNAGFTEVFTSPSFLPVIGWNTHTFSVPINWDGTSNLLIDICFDFVGSYSQNASVKFTPTTGINTSARYQNDYSVACGTTNSATTSINRANIQITGEVVSCMPPSALNATNLGPNGATLNWTAGGTETNWNVIVIETLTGDTILDTLTTSNPLVLTSLNQITNYTFFVQADCGSSDLSTWAGPATFTTTAFPLSGNYTINSTQPTAGTNFMSFTDFTTAINLGGLAGPVVVDVIAGTGPYTEQIMLGELNNSSATNTLTINGNGDTLKFLSTNTNARYTLAFDGTDYVTVNNLIIVALGEQTSEFGFAVQLMNEADFNTFTNCEFHVNTTSTSLNYAAFVTSNSASSAIALGVAANNLTIDNCKAIGGYYGIVINGPTSAPFAQNNTVINTEITDFHLRGLWLRGQNDGLFSGNQISRPTRTNTGEIYMIYLTSDMSGTEISKNRIFNFSSVANTSAANGFYGTSVTASVGDELLIANNLIYGFQNMNGAQYGMYMLTTDNTLFYHNTVSLDNVAHPGSSLIRAFHHSGNAAKIDVRNNIFSVTSNSTGTKYCMYFVQTLANIPVLTSNNNVLHMGATLGTNHLVYWNGGGGPNFTTLAAWQAAASNAYDQNSVNSNPLFMNPVNGNLMPQAYSVDNIGANLLTEVADDFFGVARTATPDPGAIEFDVPALNAGLVEILSPAPSACALTNEVVTVIVKNFGTTPITSIELGYILNGGTPVTEVFSGLNILIDEMDTLSFAVAANVSTLGMHYLTAYTNLTGDTLPLNDSIINYIIRNGHDFAAGDYFMGFEPTEYSADWTSINPDGIAGWEFPYSSTTFAKTGSFSAYFNNLTTNTDHDWLFSRCFTFDQNETYELEFYYRSGSTTVLSNMDVYLMNALSETALPIDTIIELHDFTGTTHQKAIARFTVPTTGTYYVAWKNFSAPSATKNAIDDINITLVPPAEAALVEITKPVAGCDLGLEQVEVVIINTGAQAITTPFSVSYQVIGNSTIVTETIATPNIAVFDTLVYQFSANVDLTTTMDSVFDIVSWVTLPNDPITTNDTSWTSIMSGYIPTTPVTTNDTVPYGAFAHLSALSDGDIKWYDDNMGTTLLHTGSVYVTDSIFADTTFYVQAASGGSESAGKTTYASTANTSGAAWGLVFNVVNSPTKISSVDVFSVGTGGQIIVELRSNTGALIEAVGPFTYPAGTTANPVQVTLPLNLSVPVGTGYRLVSGPMSGNLIRETSGNTFPYTSPSGNVIIQSGYISGTSQTYYWFYNWQIGEGSGCTNPTFVPVSAILETPICYFVSNVTVDTVGQDYAVINWVAGGSETQWEIEYGPVGFTQGTGMTQMSNATTDTIFYLDHSSHYDFYVRAFCDPNYSAWNGPHTFTTQCGAVSVYPYEEGFETLFPPLCWSNNLWDQSKYGAALTGSEWAYSNNVGSELTTPEFAIPTAGAYFYFWYRAEGASYPQDFDVLLSTDGLNFNDTIEIFTGVTNTTYNKYMYDLSAYANQNIWIQFVGQTGTGGSAWGILIDDFFIDEIPACDMPSMLAADTIEANSAYLSWTGGIDMFEIEWDTLGFVQGTGNIVGTSNNSYFLSGLTPETTYEFYVRAYCIFDTTLWAGPYAFTTPASCVIPDSLDTVSIAHDNFVITWMSNAYLYEIEWDTTGFVLGTGNNVITSDNPYTISGLMPLTSYDVYIRAICDTVLGDTSYWVGPFTVTTTLNVGMSVVNDMNISIYPNPSNGLINIQMLEKFETLEFTILNIQGQVLYAEQLSGLVKGSIKQMNLNLPAGVYFIRMNNEQTTAIQKLIIN